MSYQDLHLPPGRPSPALVADASARYSPRHARDMGESNRTADNWGPPLRVRPVRHTSLPEPLTERETEVLALLRGPLLTREIAAELGLSPNTVKTHIRAIYRKLGVCTRATAVSRYPSLRIRPARHPGLPEPLTEREIEVLGLLRGSLPLREIAAELRLSPNTIKTHIRAIYRKLGVSSRAAAITRGQDTGILRPGGRKQLYEAYSGPGSWAAQVSA
jgi:DNA-binding NarL/FixJ family response regulator